MKKEDPEPPTLYLKRLDMLMHIGLILTVLAIFVKVLFI